MALLVWGQQATLLHASTPYPIHREWLDFSPLPGGVNPSNTQTQSSAYYTASVKVRAVPELCVAQGSTLASLGFGYPTATGQCRQVCNTIKTAHSAGQQNRAQKQHATLLRTQIRVCEAV
jgi:hypothetical protein